MRTEPRDGLGSFALTLPIALGVGAIPVGLLAAFGGLGRATDQRLAAVLAFAGVLVTAAVSWVGLLVRVQSERRLEREHADEQARLQLDAAMRAGELFSTSDGRSPEPATVASGLLALTQLVAAELLCRNAHRLDLCQSLHWPASIDGSWNPSFGTKTKVLIVEGLVQMACRSEPSRNALQSLAVRPPTRTRSFYNIAQTLSLELATWADRCEGIEYRPGAMAASAS